MARQGRLRWHVAQLQIAPVLAERTLLERQAHLRALSDAFEQAADRRGASIVLEGPAGAGKSALVAAAAELADTAGLTMLTARGSELERGFGFGAIRQLFEGVLATADAEEREALLLGAAAPAERVVTPTAVPSDGVSDGFATLHAIYWLAVNLAAGRPLVLIADDAHWMDASSLRALAFIAARSVDAGIIVLTATRPEEPGAHVALLDELRMDPGAVRLALDPLGRASVARLVRDRLPSADDAACDACLTATAGNPLYLQELLRTISSSEALPSTDLVEAVQQASVPSLGDRVVRRIERVAPEAPALAAAMAVVGDGHALSLAAGLAGIPPSEAGKAAHGLRRIEVLATEDPFSFVHPLVRRSVYDAIPVTERDSAHAAAADVLRHGEAPAEAIAAHLANVAPNGSTLVASTFVEAAESALAKAAPDEAIRWFRRALEEGATDPPAAEILHYLGKAELILFDPEAIDHLERALDLARGSEQRSKIAVALAEALFISGRWDHAMEVIGSTLEKLGDSEPSAAAELGALGLMISCYAPALVHGLDDNRQQLAALSEGPSWAAHALAAMLASLAAHRGEGREKVTALVDRALEGGELLTERGAGTWAAAHVLIALVEIDDFERGLAVSEEVIAIARRDGSINGRTVGADHRGWIYARQGRLAAAEAELRPGLAMAVAAATPTVFASQLFFLLDPILERPSLDDAAKLAEASELPPPMADTWMGAILMTVRGQLRATRFDRSQGIEDLRASLEIAAALEMGPSVCPSRSLLALALPASEQEEAQALVSEELELARESGLPRPEGVALRAAGIVEDGERAIELLSESVAVLEGSGARLELARSLVELGAAYRRAGNRAQARPELTAGLEAAHECGAIRLVDRAREELHAAGGRPRRIATTGVEALTPSERRVADLAARGATNAQIAQELYVSLKTVETHLTHVYAKLELSGRGGRDRLADTLKS